MKNFTYTSIAIVSLSVISCRDQQDMVQLNDVQKTEVSKSATPDNNSATTYNNFDSSTAEQGDPVKPPND